MRDKRFVAVHRGGALTRANHRLLIRWARKCTEHVLSLLDNSTAMELRQALHVAKEWEEGCVPTGDAMKAAAGAHAAARKYTDPVATAVARSTGHAIATAHMADHSPGAALYALKALRLAGKPVDQEKAWQIEQLQRLLPEMADLVNEVLAEKGKRLKIG